MHVKQALGIDPRSPLSARALAARSWAALDRPLACSAELSVGVALDGALVLGAFQRASEAGEGPLPIVRRGSGGAAAWVAPGSIWVSLALARLGAVVPCDAPRLLNRYVRPLLRGLTRAGTLAHYFGRDWVSADKRPVALVAFGYDQASGRGLVEAIVGVEAPFASGPRASFLGKEPASLRALGSRKAPDEIGIEIVRAYEALATEAALPIERLDGASSDAAGQAVADEPAWAASRDEALGRIAAGLDARGRMRLGGELMVARDALARLEAGFVALGERQREPAAVSAVVDGALGDPSAALFGVKELASICDVLVEAARS